jgi:hypothetical protein
MQESLKNFANMLCIVIHELFLEVQVKLKFVYIHAY